MPIKISVDNLDSEIVLDIVEFIEEKDLRYFCVKNSDEIGINIRYIPIDISHWDKNQFDIYLFENSYLNAENDVFEVYENAIPNERLGWIFPITILESNENDFVDYKNLNNYKFIAYQKLLELSISVKLKGNSDEYYKLSDLFGDLIVCVICKETAKKIDNFAFINYTLSLYKYGYLFLGDTRRSKMIYDRTDFIREMRSVRARVKLILPNFDIYSNGYTKSLFVEHLLQSENYIIRFIFLYQIIEHFIQQEFDKSFQLHLTNYTEGKLSKNDLRERINNSSRERDLIRSVLELIEFPNELKGEFIQECEYLFNDLKLDSKDGFSDKIYDFRNLITHNYREVADKSEILKKITEIFERIIIDLLINYKETK